MRRVVGFVLASVLTAVGALALTFLVLQLLIGGQLHAKPILAAALIFGVGAYWLWVDFIAVPEREG
jgi:hypothetical protein